MQKFKVLPTNLNLFHFALFTFLNEDFLLQTTLHMRKWWWQQAVLGTPLLSFGSVKADLRKLINKINKAFMQETSVNEDKIIKTYCILCFLKLWCPWTVTIWCTTNLQLMSENWASVPVKGHPLLTTQQRQLSWAVPFQKGTADRHITTKALQKQVWHCPLLAVFSISFGRVVGGVWQGTWQPMTLLYTLF